MTVRHAEITVSHKQKGLKTHISRCFKRFTKNKSVLAHSQNSFTPKI